jgi:hypothetical protein
MERRIVASGLLVARTQLRNKGQRQSTTLRVDKTIMDTSLDRIRAKIAELDAKILDLRIAERELQALEGVSERKTRRTPGPKAKPKPEASEPEESDQAPARQTIGAAIAEVLGQYGALPAAEIAAHIKATGRDITNRTVSFSLQALKKRGLVKSADGKWTLPKARSKSARSE